MPDNVPRRVDLALARGSPLSGPSQVFFFSGPGCRSGTVFRSGTNLECCRTVSKLRLTPLPSLPHFALFRLPDSSSPVPTTPRCASSPLRKPCFTLSLPEPSPVALPPSPGSLPPPPPPPTGSPPETWTESRASSPSLPSTPRPLFPPTIPPLRLPPFSRSTTTSDQWRPSRPRLPRPPRARACSRPDGTEPSLSSLSESEPSTISQCPSRCKSRSCRPRGGSSIRA